MSGKKVPVLDAPFLDAEEKEELGTFEAAVDDMNLPEPDAARRAHLESAARRTMNPPKKAITTRLAVDDLARLKARALALGIPYQTLLASIVHRYVDGTLVDADQRDSGA